jgi:hypothetical protein
MNADDDFDGRHEWLSEMENGQVARSVLDTDGDGSPEQERHFDHGVLSRVDYYSGGRIVKRQFYESGLLDAAEYDDDGDGVFERSVKYDKHAEPVM